MSYPTDPYLPKLASHSHAWHQDDTVDAEQILVESLHYWGLLSEEDRTDARLEFYGNLFKVCADYLSSRMLHLDQSPNANRSANATRLSTIEDSLKNILKDR